MHSMRSIPLSSTPSTTGVIYAMDPANTHQSNSIDDIEFSYDDNDDDAAYYYDYDTRSQQSADDYDADTNDDRSNNDSDSVDDLDNDDSNNNSIVNTASTILDANAATNQLNSKRGTTATATTSNNNYNNNGRSNSIEEVTQPDSGKKTRTYVTIPSLFPDKEPTILFFSYDKSPQDFEGAKTVVISGQPQTLKDRGLYFKFSSNAIEYGCVRNAFKRAGFKLTRGSGTGWNALWGKHPKPTEYAKLNPYQKVNHFPGTWHVGRKDNLHKNLSRMRRTFPKDYDFFPHSYLLPMDYESLATEYEQRTREAEANGSPGPVFIVKPNASSRGRGIHLVDKIDKLKKKKDILVQRYLADPYLINGYKFDLRIYVVVTSFDPLRIYIFEDGLVRFATEKYRGTKNLKNRFVHLTNYSVNKKHVSKFVQPKGEDTNSFEQDSNSSDIDIDSAGSKWSLNALRRYFARTGVCDFDKQVWPQIKDVVLKTIIAAESKINSQMKRTVPAWANSGTAGICYELFGFDILLDRQLKPWVIEVNIAPSLSSSSPLDKKIKSDLISEMLNMVGFVPFDRKKFKEQQEEQKRTRLLGVADDSNKKRKRTLFSLRESDGLTYVTEEDAEIIKQTEDEWNRRGHFERIFPKEGAYEQYAKFFESDRYCNVLLDKWLNEKRKRLHQFQQQSGRTISPVAALLQSLVIASEAPRSSSPAPSALTTSSSSNNNNTTAASSSSGGKSMVSRINLSSKKLQSFNAAAEVGKTSGRGTTLDTPSSAASSSHRSRASATSIKSSVSSGSSSSSSSMSTARPSSASCLGRRPTTPGPTIRRSHAAAVASNSTSVAPVAFVAPINNNPTKRSASNGSSTQMARYQSSPAISSRAPPTSNNAVFATPYHHASPAIIRPLIPVDKKTISTATVMSKYSAIHKPPTTANPAVLMSSKRVASTAAAAGSNNRVYRGVLVPATVTHHNSGTTASVVMRPNTTPTPRALAR